MFAPFRKYQKAIGLVVVVILLLMTMGVTSQDRESPSFFEQAVIEVTTPVQGIISGIGGRIQAAYNFITELQELSEENRELRNKLDEYQRLEADKEEFYQENQRLRSMLGFKEREEYDLEPAKVVGRSSDDWNRTIMINKGKNDGVEHNMPVITDRGLVGRITSVSNSSSKVLLLIDPDSAVTGLVQNSREMGIVEGKDDLSSELQMINLPQDAELNQGDQVVSSGLGPVFPKGLVIGEIIELEEEMSGFTNKAFIEPAVNFSQLEEVFLVKGGGPTIEEDELEELEDLPESFDEMEQENDEDEIDENHDDEELNEEDGMEE